MTHHDRTAAATRTITDAMRAAVNAYRGHWHQNRVTFGVTLDRRYNRRRYAVDLKAGMWASWPIMVDTTGGTAWVAPAARLADKRARYGTLHTGDEWHEWLAAETLHIDALFAALAAAGYTLSPHSETPATLAEWRATRTAADVIPAHRAA